MVERKTRRSQVKAIQVKLTPAQIKRAESCLARTGKVRIKMKEISATKLPAKLPSSIIIVD
jgi:hypothetical protein